MESKEVRNVDEEAAFPLLLGCARSCPGLGSRALTPALPSHSWASDFASCLPFFLASLVCEMSSSEILGRQMGFVFS